MIAFLIDLVTGVISSLVSDRIKDPLFPRWAKRAPALPDLGPNMAGPSRLFFGRQQFLAEVAAALESHRRVALYGPGGMGKTQAALHYRDESPYRDRYSRVFWLPAEQPEVLAREFARLTTELGLPVPDGDMVEATRRVQQWLRQNSGWLLIFDNVGEPKEIARYLSGGPGHTLITSQNPNWKQAAEPLEVSPLSIEDAAEFLVARGRLAEELGRGSWRRSWAPSPSPWSRPGPIWRRTGSRRPTTCGATSGRSSSGLGSPPSATTTPWPPPGGWPCGR